jgi:hypothetical protein
VVLFGQFLQESRRSASTKVVEAHAARHDRVSRHLVVYPRRFRPNSAASASMVPRGGGEVFSTAPSTISTLA